MKMLFDEHYNFFIRIFKILKFIIKNVFKEIPQKNIENISEMPETFKYLKL